MRLFGRVRVKLPKTDLVLVPRADKPVPAYVQSQCERGAKILFESAPGFNHTVASVVWTGDAYNYLESAFDGTLKLDQCNQTLGVSAQPGTPAYISAIGPTAWSLIQGQM